MAFSVILYIYITYGMSFCMFSSQIIYSGGNYRYKYSHEQIWNAIQVRFHHEEALMRKRDTNKQERWRHNTAGEAAQQRSTKGGNAGYLACIGVVT